MPLLKMAYPSAAVPFSFAPSARRSPKTLQRNRVPDSAAAQAVAFAFFA